MQQDYKESFIEGKIHSKKLEWRPQILLQQSFRELRHSKLSGLHNFDVPLSQKTR